MSDTSLAAQMIEKKLRKEVLLLKEKLFSRWESHFDEEFSLHPTPAQALPIVQPLLFEDVKHERRSLAKTTRSRPPKPPASSNGNRILDKPAPSMSRWSAHSDGPVLNVHRMFDQFSDNNVPSNRSHSPLLDASDDEGTFVSSDDDDGSSADPSMGTSSVASPHTSLSPPLPLYDFRCSPLPFLPQSLVPLVTVPPVAPLALHGAKLHTQHLPTPEQLQALPPVKSGTNMPMLRTKPFHACVSPVEPEPLYVAPPGLLDRLLQQETERLLRSEMMNRVVFDSVDPSSFNHGATQSSDDLPPFYIPSSPTDTTLVFESRFESGNLRRAIQIAEFEYDLILRPDINSRGHTQWYYFSISNTRANLPYRFNIINMIKPDSMYNHGLKPVLYSEIEAHYLGVGWKRIGSDVGYYQNHLKRRGGGAYYTLTFTVTCNHDKDTVYLAHCYPYTYTDLQLYLLKLESDPARRNRVRRRVLCQTLAGNSCDLLTITSFTGDPAALRARKGVVITARVHPGETNASWMMKGFIDFLTGPSLDAKILRDNFVFKLVPMLNPDGVINGNYRCSLSGDDLNRQWSEPSKTKHPTIHYTKSMIKRLMDDREVVLFCDLHGHSRKSNIFIYGCSNKQDNRLKERIFPRLLEKASKTFSFADCHFHVDKSKENTARVVVWRDFRLTNSYTMEASFCGANFGRFANAHFNISHLEEIGHLFCDAILDLCDPDQSKVQEVMAELQLMFPVRADEEVSDGSAGGSDYSEDGQRKKKKKKKKIKRKKKVEKSKKKSDNAVDPLTQLLRELAPLKKKKVKRRSKKKSGRVSEEDPRGSGLPDRSGTAPVGSGSAAAKNLRTPPPELDMSSAAVRKVQGGVRTSTVVMDIPAVDDAEVTILGSRRLPRIANPPSRDRFTAESAAAARSLVKHSTASW